MFLFDGTDTHNWKARRTRTGREGRMKEIGGMEIRKRRKREWLKQNGKKMREEKWDTMPFYMLSPPVLTSQKWNTKDFG